eukprot:evm.model.NODE_40448_length_11543_cov_19.550550.3
MDELSQVSRGVRGEDTSTLSEPENSLRRPFWQLNLLRATITTGGFLTPRLHVPRLVWEQWGAKLNGLTTKATAFEAVLSLLVDRILPLELLSSNNNPSRKPQSEDGEAAQRDLPKAQKALLVLEGVRAEFDFLQNSLARLFLFVKEVSTTTTSTTTTTTTTSQSSIALALASSSSSSAASSFYLGSGGGMQQMRGLMTSFRKKIQKSAVSAMTAVERMGVALPAKISDEDLLSYASLVSEMCHKAQRLDEWFVSLDLRRKELQEALRREVSPSASSSSSSSSSSFSSSSLSGKEAIQALLHCVEGMLVELLHCARFLQEVVIELLLRDVESLVDSYLRKARKVFTRMVWELEEQENS